MMLFLLMIFLALARGDEVEATVAPVEPVPTNDVATVAAGTISETDLADPIPEVDPTVPAEPSYLVCRPDAERLCPSELASGDRSSLCNCMKRHMDELSPECHAFVLTKKGEREAAFAACQSDVSTFCPEAFEQGRWELRRCMMKHFHELSSNCSEFIRKKLDEISPNACDSDASTLCSSAVGFSATLTCLKENIKTVTPECVRFLFKPTLNATEAWYPGKFRGHDDKHDREDWHGRDREERHGDRHKDRDDWRHGWMKHKSEKKWERKTRRDQERLYESCGKEVTTFCAEIESLHDKKECLAMNYASLDKSCAEFLISSSDDDDEEEEHHEHMMKLVFMIIGFILLVSLVCACRRRCKRRRQMWREMHRNMARTQEPTRYIAVPTQSIPLPGQVQQAQMVPMPTAPQQLQPQSSLPTYSQGIVYSASPYTGGIPISAVPVAYNPQAVSIA